MFAKRPVLSSSCNLPSFLKLKSDIRWGKKVKLIKYVQISPKDIIKPKSITGFIPLVYRVAKANIVVRAEYKHGLYIFCKHKVMDEKVLKFAVSFKICLYLTTMCTVIDRDKIKINIIKLEDITVTFH